MIDFDAHNIINWYVFNLNYVDKYLHKHKDINNFNISCNIRYYENVFFNYDKQT